MKCDTFWGGLSDKPHLPFKRACAFGVLTYSPPTLTSVGHQWTVSTNIACNQWLSLAKPTLKVLLADRNRSLMVRTSKSGWAIIWHWGPLHTQDWEPVTNTLQALPLVEKVRWSRSKFASHYACKVCECNMDAKSTWIHTWHQMDHVSRSLGMLSNLLWEVGLTQNRETMALWTLTIVDVFYFIMVEDPSE